MVFWRAFTIRLEFCLVVGSLVDLGWVLVLFVVTWRFVLCWLLIFIGYMFAWLFTGWVFVCWLFVFLFALYGCDFSCLWFVYDLTCLSGFRFSFCWLRWFSAFLCCCLLGFSVIVCFLLAIEVFTYFGEVLGFIDWCVFAGILLRVVCVVNCVFICWFALFWFYY